MSSDPKTVYDAAIAYRTPAGKLTWFRQTAIAGHTLSEVDDEMQRRLRNEQRFGRRRVGEYVGRFTAFPIGKQIQTR